MPAEGSAEWRGDVPTGVGTFTAGDTKAGHPPELVRTDATVTLRPVDGTPTITNIALVTVGRVPGIDEATFKEHAAAAKAGCPVSRALAGVPDITLDARLMP